MNKQRVEDYERVISLNKSAEELYDKLALLEFNKKMLSEEYTEYVMLIKKINEITKTIINKYPLEDDFINIYIESIIKSRSFHLDEYVLHIKDDKDMNYKRFIEDLGEIELANNIKNPQKINGTIEIFGEEYDLDYFLENCDEEILNLLKENNIDNFYPDSLILTSNYINLYLNTFTDYILRQIEMLNNPNLIHRMIKFKYNLLKLYRCLEDNFLINPASFTQTKLYQKAIDSYYPREMNYFSSNDRKNAEIIEKELYILLCKEYETYTSYDDAIDDLLSVAYIKTLTSLMSNEHNVEVVKKGVLKAIDLSNNQLSKILLAHCCNLNNRLLLHKELKINKDDAYARK